MGGVGDYAGYLYICGVGVRGFGDSGFAMLQSIACHARRVAKIFDAAGLHIQKTYGNYQLQPFRREESPRLILVAQKK